MKHPPPTGEQRDAPTDPDRPAITRSDLLFVFTLALVLRAGFGIALLVRAEDPSALTYPDEEQYWMIATSLWHGEGLVDELGFRATRMPLYPAFLAPLTGLPYGQVAAKALHWLLGAVGAAATAGLGAAMFNRRAGRWAGVFVAVDPFLVFFSSLLLTETAFIVALIVLCRVAWTVARPDDPRTGIRQWALIGLCSLLCVYLRESSVGLVGAMLFMLVAVRRMDRTALAGSVLAVAIVIGGLSPWAMRNHVVTGDWCFLTHRGGISLYDGVGPQATGESNLGDIKQMEAVRGLDEVQWNRFFLAASWRAVRDDPVRIVRLGAVKLARTWNPIPNAESHRTTAVRLVSAFWSIPIFVLAAACTILRSRLKMVTPRRILLLILPALYFSAVHCVFVGSVRYRLTSMPLLEILAAVAWIALCDRFTRRVQTGANARVR